jgi:two-component system, OmpR family, response regulator CpxR
MPLITLLSAAYCKENEIANQIEDQLKIKVVNDTDIIAKASRLSGISPSKIEGILRGETSIFNRFSHEKEKAISAIKVELSKMLNNDKQIFFGWIGQLIPRTISHVLSICLTAERSFRVQNAIDGGLSKKDAKKEIDASDSQLALWMNDSIGANDPWDASLYDMLIPANKTSPDALLAMIKGSEKILKTTDVSRQAQEDFALAARVEWELMQHGHFVDVKAYGGKIVLIINKNVLMLGKLKEELYDIVGNIEGVKQVEAKVGKDFHQSDVYMAHNFEMPEKVLLVDDERDFVQTLSERLLMREMGSVVAYDGESALDIIDRDEPEVIILDLRMPGIDGFEVLKKVKASGSNVEVIILTGHGSEKDRDTCMKLGAFAYLHKPVNIEVLSKTMQDAYKKLNLNKPNAVD